MKKRNRKNRNLIILILSMTLLVFVSAFFIIHTVYNNAKLQEAKEMAEQAEKEKAEKEEAERAKREKIAEEKSQWYLLLVNEWNAIPDDFTIETAPVENGYVADERIVEPLKQMLADCRAAGYSVTIVSTFRTRETQQYLYDHTANKADTAIPGHSEHECGLAVDVIDSGSLGWGDPLIDAQEDMPAQKWLMEHCWEYGFILRYPKDKEEITGIIYEPWHYRYVGREHAEIIMKNGLCLEEYLRDMEAWYDPE